MTDLLTGVHVRLFGTPGVVGPSGPCRMSPFQLALVAIVYAEGLVSRTQLSRLLWQREIDRKTRHSIRQLTLATRKRAGVDIFVIEGDSILPSPGVTSDFGTLRDDLDSDRLSDAAAVLARGFLGGSSPDLPDAFDDWRAATSTGLVATIGRMARAKWTAALRDTDWRSARDAAEALYSLEPTDHETVAWVIEARGRLGRIRAAEVAYAEYCDALSPMEGPDSSVEEVIVRVRAIPSSRPELPGTREPTFVGRDAELQVITPLIEDVMSGTFKMGLISGEAGIGKTRLLHEVRRLAHLEGIRCLSARAVELEGAISLNPILDALSDIDLEEHLSRLGEPWRTVIGKTLPARSLKDPIGELPAIDERNLSRRLLDAFSLLFQQLADETPTILFLDDLHWADATTIAAVRFFQRRWQAAAFGVVGTIRTEAVGPRDPTDPYLNERNDLVDYRVGLGELAEDEALRLVLDVGEDRIDEHIAAQIFRLAGFHPLYLTEMSRDYVAERLRLPDAGSDEVPIPVSLKEILSSRTSDLSADGTAMAALLTAASAPTRLSDLAALMQLSLDGAADAADELRERGLVEGERDRLWIAHDLFKSAIYGELSETRRAVLHRKIADYLSDQGDDVADELAIHLDRAGEPERSAHYGWIAGEINMEQGSVAEAAHFFELVARNVSDPRRRAEATARRAIALHLNRDMAKAMPVLELASIRLRAAGLEREARRLDIRRVEAMAESGNATTEELVERVGAIKREASEVEDWEAVALALDVELGVLHGAGDIPAIQRLFQAFRRIVTTRDADAAAVAHMGLAMEVLFGDPEEGVRSAEEALRLTRSARKHRLKALLRSMAVLQFRGRHRVRGWDTIVEEARTLARSAGDLRIRFSIESNLAVVFLDAGELDRAESMLEDSTKLLGNAEMGLARFNQANNQAELALARGDFDRARAHFDEAERHLGPTTPPYGIDIVNAGLGLCAIESGDLAEARRRADVLGPLEVPLYFDPGTLVSFQVRLLERRQDFDSAIELMRFVACELEGRLELAWLKINKLLLEKQLKWHSLDGAEDVVRACIEVSTDLALTQRRKQFNALHDRLMGKLLSD